MRRSRRRAERSRKPRRGLRGPPSSLAPPFVAQQKQKQKLCGW